MPPVLAKELFLSVLTLIVACSSAVAKAADADADADAGRIEIDREGQEIRFPCRFVNPTQILEVFSCHSSGPTHETVLEFDATGPKIYAALEAIGCRNASYWSGTARDDFLQNQGDRLLVLVRWERLGKRHEHAAEGLLLEGETTFPMPVRGFSFGARTPAKTAAGASDNDEGESTEGPAGVPTAVEFSLGAAARHQPPNSLLSHPSTSAHLQPWMLPPRLDRSVVQAHRKLVEEQIPVTLIIRRVRSEAELIKAARAVALRRGLSESGPLYDRLEPIAREIDGLKADYEELLSSIRQMLAQGVVENAKDAEREALANRGLDLLRRGRWLCARIEERYLALYALEEDFKAAWVEKRTELPDEIREEALVRARDGYSFEPLIAAKRVDLAALDLAEFSGLPAERRIRGKIAENEIEVLELRRKLRLTRAYRRQQENLLKEVLSAAADERDAEAVQYRANLFRSDILREDIRIQSLTAKLHIAQTWIAEFEGRVDGTWEEKKTDVRRKRRLGERKLALADLEANLLETADELRWSENYAADRDPERRERARKKILELEQKRAGLEKKIEAAKQGLES